MATRKRTEKVTQPIVKSSVQIELSSEDAWTEPPTVAHVIEWLKQVELAGINPSTELSYDSFLSVNSGKTDAD